jgi:hypothetical protein
MNVHSDQPNDQRSRERQSEHLEATITGDPHPAGVPSHARVVRYGGSGRVVASGSPIGLNDYMVGPRSPEPCTDYFPPELARLTATAATVLRLHVAADGQCMACGEAWPCRAACLAEHNLAGL